MRVSAEEELDQCARETRIIEDTYITQVTVPIVRCRYVGGKRRGAIEGACLLGLGGFTDGIAAAVGLGSLEDASGARVATVVQGARVAVITNFVTGLTQARRGDALIDRACVSVVAVHGVLNKVACARHVIAFLNAIALISVLANDVGERARARTRIAFVGGANIAVVASNRGS